VSTRSTFPPTLLCVANFPSNAGYAWDFFDGLYARVADALAQRGVRTLVAYPKLRGAPRTLARSMAIPVELEFGFDTRRQTRATLRFIRSNHVRAVYLTDHAASSLYYLILRLVGVRHIVVYDHTSGERSAPRGIRRVAKWVFVRVPGVAADVVMTVSDYVAARQIQTGSSVPGRVVRVWNGIPPRPIKKNAESILRGLARVASDRILIVCCCRADAVKGVSHLLRAFDVACKQLRPDARQPALVYIGDGPQRRELDAIRDSLDSSQLITFLGYREDASRLLGDADICVVPSVWQDAFPLGVLEPMAAGKPVIATMVGGIPEMIEDGVTGILVPPANDRALASALTRLLTNPELAAKLGVAARLRVAERFTPEQQIEALIRIVGRCFPIQQ
jgi:glycosyltransferase involved in cell wall biosynthesis